MAREWTSAQKTAIDERNRTLLVSAAAGSGKTAVLTERIIRSLCDPDHPTDISRLLVVTFTRAAAGEMRARIAKALGEALSLSPGNTKLSRQLMLLGSARISTIDSFYLDLVRNHFEEAGFSPSFRMADEGELLSMRHDMMNSAIDAMYAQSPDFIGVAELLSDVRNEHSLCDHLLEIAAQLEKLPERYDILLRSAKESETLYKSPLSTPVGRVLLDVLTRMASEGKRLFSAALDAIKAEGEEAALQKKFGKPYTEMLEHATALETALTISNIDKITAALTAPMSARVGSTPMPPCSEDFVALIEPCAEYRSRWKKRATALGGFHTEEIRDGGREAATILTLLHRVLTVYDERYRAAKHEREVAEFSDVSRAAYHLLVDKNGDPTPLAKSLAASFDAIYIDEYQDVDAMQDATFRAISTDRNRFMVGDIKQSIYRFRGAEPAVFTGYRKSFPDYRDVTDADPVATVFMSSCFRCDENIIRFSNTVSGYLFSHAAEAIGYKKEDDLICGKKPPSEDYISPKCRVLIYDDEKDETTPPDRENEETSSTQTVIDSAEAVMIVNEIKQLLKNERKADGTPITPGDIAVLSRGAAFAAPLAEMLSAEGIPVNDTSKENFFENPEVLCMYALLATIDNPFRDVYLAAVLRSPLFGFTLEELVQVRGAADTSFSLYEALGAARDRLENISLGRRVDDFLRKLTLYREKAELLPVDKLLRFLFADTAVLALTDDKTVNGMGLGTRQNLRRLYEYARSFEVGGFKGLYRFVRYVEDIMQNGTQMPTPEGPHDAVSLITIHHSKGLEFPVCFVATAGKTFNAEDQRRPLLIDSELGCGTRVPSIGAFTRANTFAREAIRERLAKLAAEEEMRVLYVAMTRARERLYVTAKPRYGIKNMQKHIALATCPATDYFALCGNSYLEWILTALARVDHRDFCEITYIKQADLVAANSTNMQKAEAPPKHVEDYSVDATQELTALFDKRFSFSYHATHLTRLPAKLSVSRLTPEVLDVYDCEATHECDLHDPDADTLLHTFERTPIFSHQSASHEFDAATRGTATHEFLQFCDFKKAENGIENELDRLVEQRFVSPETREAVRLDELERFFKSEFYARLKTAKEIHRETRFNLFLPAADFTADPTLRAELTNEKLLVQGVIDLFFLNAEGELVLCDYKTDRLPKQAFADKSLARNFLFTRHGRQLAYYKQALAAIFGKTPDKTLIYSLPLGEALEEPIQTNS